MNINPSGALPNQPEPCWRENLPFPSFPALNQDIETDVLIAGGGITGLTAAYLLGKAGKKVTLIEAGNLLNGTTGHTTAKVTAQHGLIYDQLITDFGEEKARLYYEANSEAISLIKQLIKDEQIDCHFTKEDAYVYTASEDYISKIQNELKAYQKLGIPGSYAEEIPFSIPCKAAVIMKDQYQFHPLEYLTGLLPSIQNSGVQIYENTTAKKVNEGSKPVIETDTGYTITCNFLLTASHFPFNDENGMYFARMHPERSYVLGVKADNVYPGGMYITAESPSRSIRSAEINGETLYLIGGDGHKTGQGEQEMKHYEALLDFSRQHFTVDSVPYRWSAQDLVTADKLPYIGPASSGKPNLLTATGFAKWGMTNGTIAAKILTDYIMNKENRFAELFNPSRFEPEGIKNLVKDNANVAAELIKGKLASAPGKPEELEAGQAAVMKVNGQKAGCYRDQEGALHIVDSTCTHMGCEVKWNSGDTSWDCPCHGSRFSIDGKVLEGPAVDPLEKLTYKAD